MVYLVPSTYCSGPHALIFVFFFFSFYLVRIFRSPQFVCVSLPKGCHRDNQIESDGCHLPPSLKIRPISLSHSLFLSFSFSRMCVHRHHLFTIAHISLIGPTGRPLHGEEVNGSSERTSIFFV